MHRAQVLLQRDTPDILHVMVSEGILDAMQQASGPVLLAAYPVLRSVSVANCHAHPAALKLKPMAAAREDSRPDTSPHECC